MNVEIENFLENASKLESAELKKTLQSNKGNSNEAIIATKRMILTGYATTKNTVDFLSAGNIIDIADGFSEADCTSFVSTNVCSPVFRKRFVDKLKKANLPHAPLDLLMSFVSIHSPQDITLCYDVVQIWNYIADHIDLPQGGLREILSSKHSKIFHSRIVNPANNPQNLCNSVTVKQSALFTSHQIEEILRSIMALLYLRAVELLSHSNRKSCQVQESNEKDLRRRILMHPRDTDALLTYLFGVDACQTDTMKFDTHTFYKDLVSIRSKLTPHGARLHVRNAISFTRSLAGIVSHINSAMSNVEKIVHKVGEWVLYSKLIKSLVCLCTFLLLYADSERQSEQFRNYIKENGAISAAFESIFSMQVSNVLKNAYNAWNISATFAAFAHAQSVALGAMLSLLPRNILDSLRSHNYKSEIQKTWGLPVYNKLSLVLSDSLAAVARTGSTSYIFNAAVIAWMVSAQQWDQVILQFLEFFCTHMEFKHCTYILGKVRTALAIANYVNIAKKLFESLGWDMFQNITSQAQRLLVDSKALSDLYLQLCLGHNVKPSKTSAKSRPLTTHGAPKLDDATRAWLQTDEPEWMLKSTKGEKHYTHVLDNSRASVVRSEPVLIKDSPNYDHSVLKAPAQINIKSAVNAGLPSGVINHPNFVQYHGTHSVNSTHAKYRPFNTKHDNEIGYNATNLTVPATDEVHNLYLANKSPPYNSTNYNFTRSSQTPANAINHPMLGGLLALGTIAGVTALAVQHKMRFGQRDDIESIYDSDWTR